MSGFPSLINNSGGKTGGKRPSGEKTDGKKTGRENTSGEKGRSPNLLPGASMLLLLTNFVASTLKLSFEHCYDNIFPKPAEFSPSSLLSIEMKATLLSKSFRNMYHLTVEHVIHAVTFISI